MLDEKRVQFVEKFKADMESTTSKFDSDMAAAASLEEFMTQAPLTKMKLWRRELGLTMDSKFIGFEAFKATAADLKKALKTNTVLLMDRIEQATADKT